MKNSNINMCNFNFLKLKYNFCLYFFYFEIKLIAVLVIVWWRIKSFFFETKLSEFFKRKSIIGRLRLVKFYIISKNFCVEKRKVQLSQCLLDYFSNSHYLKKYLDHVYSGYFVIAPRNSIESVIPLPVSKFILHCVNIP